jgi:hypothetical protein
MIDIKPEGKCYLGCGKDADCVLVRGPHIIHACPDCAATVIAKIAKLAEEDGADLTIVVAEVPDEDDGRFV